MWQSESARNRNWEQWQRDKKRIRLISGGTVLCVIVGLLGVSYRLWQGAHYLLISMMLLFALFLLLMMNLERKKPRAREIVLWSTMTGLTVAANEICSHTIPLHAGTTFVVISGIALGPEAGFFIGALARFLCNFFAGQGPWTPWQMVAWGLLGYLAGLFFNKIELRGKLEPVSLAERISLQKNNHFRLVVGPVLSVLASLVTGYVIYILAAREEENFFGWWCYVFGFVGLVIGGLIQRRRMPVDAVTTTVYTFFTVVILYGGIMNFSAMVTSANDISMVSIPMLKALYITGLPYDLVHAATAALCMFFFGDMVLQKIERIQVKFGIGA
ncbi:MAG: ECF transporter S component [Eubacterium sp.]|nr:ECF transporter S component [Eubacterium sp.]